jgi:hypothetical protein
MLIVNVPERLTGIIDEMAKQFCQTPEESVIEMIGERLEHQSAYRAHISQHRKRTETISTGRSKISGPDVMKFMN